MFGPAAGQSRSSPSSFCVGIRRASGAGLLPGGSSSSCVHSLNTEMQVPANHQACMAMVRSDGMVWKSACLTCFSSTFVAGTSATLSAALSCWTSGSSSAQVTNRVRPGLEISLGWVSLKHASPGCVTAQKACASVYTTPHRKTIQTFPSKML